MRRLPRAPLPDLRRGLLLGMIPLPMRRLSLARLPVRLAMPWRHTGHRSGRTPRTRKGLLEQTLLSSLMARCAVRQDMPCMRKSEGRSETARCVCCMLVVLPLAARALFGSEARENGANTIHPRRVSAVFWPRTSTPPEADTSVCDAPISDAAVSDAPACDPPSPSRSVLWGDWQRCQIRRQWVQLLQTQTVLMTFSQAETIAQEKEHPPPISTRAQRAHWRLSWEERLARNARPPTAPSLVITLHGLPATFVQSFGLPVIQAA